MEVQRPAPPRWTVRMANRHRYCLGLPEIPTRIRREPSGDRSHPCAETPHAAAHRLPARYGLTTEQARLDRVSSRSEEHTSELQSQSNLVCRLLLEKKKK